MNRQRLILFILVIFFGIAALWSYSAIPRFKTVSQTPSETGRQAKPALAATDNKPAHDTDDGTILKIGLLDKESTGFKGYRRDLFKPIFVDAMKILKQNAVTIKPPPIMPPVQVQPVVTQPEIAPLARFTFLGFLKKGTARTVFLAKDKDILLVKIGDKIAGRYEATDISDQALTLTVTDTGDKIVIPLIENRHLAPAR